MHDTMRRLYVSWASVSDLYFECNPVTVSRLRFVPVPLALLLRGAPLCQLLGSRDSLETNMW